jgi:hypothetical protein
MKIHDTYQAPSLDTLRKGISYSGFQHYYFKHSPVGLDLADTDNPTDYLAEAIELHNRLVKVWRNLNQSVIDGQIDCSIYGRHQQTTVTKYNFNRNKVLTSVNTDTGDKFNLRDTDFSFNLYANGQSLNDLDRNRGGKVKSSAILMRCKITA